jgi:RNA polymerase sigma-70 factor (ECF subfamily)
VASPTEEEVEILHRIRQSDVNAFRVLFELYQPIVFRAALFRTRDPDLSHDIVQETFLRVWEHRTSLRPHLGVLSLLLHISSNLARDVARRNQTKERLSKRVPSSAHSEGDDPDEALLLAELQDRLASVINDDLPEKCRIIFLLSRFEGMSNRKIAEHLGISVRTVEHQIGHALKVLKKGLGH